MHKRAGDGDALLLAAGKLTGILVGLLGDAHALEIAPGRGLGFGARHLLDPLRREAQIVEHGQMREQVELLEDHAGGVADLLDLPDIVGQLGAGDDDLPLLVLLEPVDAADQRRFAGPRWAADDDLLALGDLQVDIAQDVEGAIPLVHAGHCDGTAEVTTE